MIRGDFLTLSKEQLNDPEATDDYGPLTVSRLFRKKCADKGYSLLYMYPIYYQGWEMDEWGAVGMLDGDTYLLETDHGSLNATPKDLGDIARCAMIFLSIQ